MREKKNIKAFLIKSGYRLQGGGSKLLKYLRCMLPKKSTAFILWYYTMWPDTGHLWNFVESYFLACLPLTITVASLLLPTFKKRLSIHKSVLTQLARPWRVPNWRDYLLLSITKSMKSPSLGGNILLFVVRHFISLYEGNYAQRGFLIVFSNLIRDHEMHSILWWRLWMWLEQAVIGHKYFKTTQNYIIGSWLVV